MPGQKGKEKEVGGLVPARVDQADRNEKGQVSQMFRSMASLAGIVLTHSGRQGRRSPWVWWLETSFQTGPCNRTGADPGHPEWASLLSSVNRFVEGFQFPRGAGGHLQWLWKELQPSERVSNAPASSSLLTAATLPVRAQSSAVRGHCDWRRHLSDPKGRMLRLNGLACQAILFCCVEESHFPVGHGIAKN